MISNAQHESSPEAYNLVVASHQYFATANESSKADLIIDLLMPALSYSDPGIRVARDTGTAYPERHKGGAGLD